MPSPSKELKNIPVSISILHEQEYDNLCLMVKLLGNKIAKRRAFSEKRCEEKENYKTAASISDSRSDSLSLKNQ